MLGGRRGVPRDAASEARRVEPGRLKDAAENPTDATPARALQGDPVADQLLQRADRRGVHAERAGPADHRAGRGSRPGLLGVLVEDLDREVRQTCDACASPSGATGLPNRRRRATTTPCLPGKYPPYWHPRCAMRLAGRRVTPLFDRVHASLLGGRTGSAPPIPIPPVYQISRIRQRVSTERRTAPTMAGIPPAAGAAPGAAP